MATISTELSFLGKNFQQYRKCAATYCPGVFGSWAPDQDRTSIFGRWTRDCSSRISKYSREIDYLALLRSTLCLSGLRLFLGAEAFNIFQISDFLSESADLV